MHHPVGDESRRCRVSVRMRGIRIIEVATSHTPGPNIREAKDVCQEIQERKCTKM